VVKGQVTINLEDYHALLDAKIQTLGLQEKSDLLLKELQVFLSFIVSRTDIAPYITEFNKQSKSSIIEVDTNGMVKIQKK
jgi:hypothetical protein|tara:strand:+ start:442 stop:681 length:240 start_codon:yes stop_codon:yes gene_type:complete